MYLLAFELYDPLLCVPIIILRFCKGRVFQQKCKHHDWPNILLNSLYQGSFLLVTSVSSAHGVNFAFVMW